MADVAICCGPVSAIAGVRWERPTQIVTVNHRDWPGPMDGAPRPEIVGSGAFGILAQRLGPRPLSRILEIAGISSPGRIALLGFSAAHGLIEPILSSPDAARVNALGAFDAYFTGMNKAIKRGYLAFLERAIAEEVLAVVTTSSNAGPDYPAGNASFAVLAAQLGIASEEPPPGVPEPATMQGAGDFGWADYQFQFAHAAHWNSLAPAWCNAVIAPYLATEESHLATSHGGGAVTFGEVVFGAVALVGIALGAKEAARRLAA